MCLLVWYREVSKNNNILASVSPLGIPMKINISTNPMSQRKAKMVDVRIDRSSSWMHIRCMHARWHTPRSNRSLMRTQPSRKERSFYEEYSANQRALSD
jgi:hypothetical protein